MSFFFLSFIDAKADICTSCELLQIPCKRDVLCEPCSARGCHLKKNADQLLFPYRTGLYLDPTKKRGPPKGAGRMYTLDN